MESDESCAPVTFKQVLTDETLYLARRRELAGIATDAHGHGGLRARSIGLALSGGGVRSATFNLGVLQALSTYTILPIIDYLSTVSGGGYIACCLTSLLSPQSKTRCVNASKFSAPEASDVSGEDISRFGTTPDRFPFNPEVNEQWGLAPLNGRAQLRHLRTRGEYLVTRRGLFSAEMLRAVGALMAGLFWHFFIFTLLLVAVTGLCLAMASWLIGSSAPFLGTLRPALYVQHLFGMPSVAPLGLPYWVIGLIVGFGFTVIAVPLARHWGRAKEETEPKTRCKDKAENRGILLLRLFAVLMVIVAVALAVAMVLVYRPDLHAVAIPFSVFAGGQAGALFLHAWVASSDKYDRNDRSRLAAVKGALSYLMVSGIVFAAVPYLMFLVAASRVQFPSLVWILSAVGSWFLARGGSKQPSEGIGGIMQAFARVSSSLRNALLAACVTIVVIGGAVVSGALLIDASARFGLPLTGLAFMTCAGSLVLFVVLGYLLNFNRLALSSFYADRLVETYLQTYAPEGADKYDDDAQGPKEELQLRDDSDMMLRDIHGTLPKDATGAAACVTAAPYHLILASLNLTASQDMTRRDRKSDTFIFSKLYCGSKTTGYVSTEKYRRGDTTLAHAMTISGAAASSAMGRRTFFAAAFALTLFNGRLGQWIQNPMHESKANVYRKDGWRFWPYYLLREMLGATDARRQLVHVSDGGHTGDNIGIGPLLKRRCAVIIASDAEADPKYNFGSLCEALRQTYIDENIKVDLDVDAVRPDEKTKLSGHHCAVAKIRYPETAERPAETGWLVVLKSSLTGDELARLAEYRRLNTEFPQQNTVDQFFDDNQFESYRELGYHIAKKCLGGVPNEAWQPEHPEWEETWLRLKFTGGQQPTEPTGPDFVPVEQPDR